MEWLSDPQIWAGLLTLTALEIVLGIDNLVFITILAGRLPAERQNRARQVGLALALVTRLALLGSTFAVYMASALGIGELIADKLPFVPNRTSPLPMTFRIISGAICGASLCISAHRLILAGSLLGALGAINGAFGGFHVRRLLAKYLKIKDTVIALAEDVLAIGAGLFIVSRF